MLPATLHDVLVLTRRDIAALMTLDDYFSAAELAFTALASGAAKSPLPMHLPADGGAFHVKGASLAGARPVVAIKLNGNFPGNPKKHGLPTIQGAILLADATNGSPLAIMDSIEITLRRTAAASALAAKHLARPDSARIAICGCGEQGRVQLEAMAAVLSLSDVALWDRDFSRARALADATRKTPGVAAVTPVAGVEAATLKADIIVTCTTARTPFLDVSHVRKGAFVAAVGADNPEKNEIAPALMAWSKVVADVRDQCVTMGDLHHAIAARTMTTEGVWADLGEIVTGAKPGRTNPDEIFVFDSTGTAAQDVAAAAQVYARAIERGVGTRIALGAA
jgi:ornithine cyclodeaminase/alanine dehydrogenase-like protein (mu-crystallin family)